MIDTVYIEDNVRVHPHTQRILARFPKAQHIACGRYGEVFNPKSQNFRLQKQQPALILAEKYKQFALPVPQGYGIGAKHNYYFSHMLNCLYDCRYCFLQGMYRSAHYVLFVNYEKFQHAIQDICQAHQDEEVHFFSGYDCDSLALEPLTGFVEAFLPFFDTLPKAWLELRTKSTQIRSLLNRPPVPRCVVAFSLNPDYVAEKLEHKAPSLNQRLQALEKLQQQGWLIGLRFDPIVYYANYQRDYQELFDQVFAKMKLGQLHSVSLGTFRLPEQYFKAMHKLYPDEKLFAGPLCNNSGNMSYSPELEQEILAFCQTQILKFCPSEKFFPCR